jgi:hypothetical protein
MTATPQGPALRAALKQAREAGGMRVLIEQGDYWPTRRLVVRSPKLLADTPPRSTCPPLVVQIVRSVLIEQAQTTSRHAAW